MVATREQAAPVVVKLELLEHLQTQVLVQLQLDQVLEESRLITCQVLLVRSIRAEIHEMNLAVVVVASAPSPASAWRCRPFSPSAEARSSALGR